METTKPYKILVVDDERDIVEIIRYNLQRSGYVTEAAGDGEEALEKAREFRPDLILLDIMMPRRNGLETLQVLREETMFQETMVLFLTALGAEIAEIEGLNLGADDYIIKPIKPQLLLSRIAAALRRINKENGHVIRVGDMVIDRERFSVVYKGADVFLAKKEFELLAFLASRPGRVFPRPEILRHVWGDGIIVGDRTVDVHVRRIRQKTGDIISTVKGVGYRLEV